jgi:hypothetical protein
VHSRRIGWRGYNKIRPEDSCYLNMSLLAEQKKELLKMAASQAKRTISAMTTFLHNLTDATQPGIKLVGFQNVFTTA